MFVESYLRDLRRERYRPRAVALYVYRCAHASARAALERPAAMRGLALAGLGHLVVLCAAAVALVLRVDRSLGVDFFVATASWLLGGLVWIGLHLGMFRRDRELPRSGLGLPNFLTLGRLICIPAFTVFLLRGSYGLALLAFLVGGATDVADGFVARRFGSGTRLGKIFDPVVDVLFNAGVALALTRAGYLPSWLLALIFLRYGLLMAGSGWIYIFRGPVAVRPTVLGKTTGVITAGLILAVVLVRHFAPIGARGPVMDLLHLTLGFVFVLSTVQVVIMGIYNIRHLGESAAPEGVLSVIVGAAEGEATASSGGTPSGDA